MSDATSPDIGFSDEQLELLDFLLDEEEVDESAVAAIPRRDDRETHPLSFAQERMWFIAELEPESPAYNIPAAVSLHGDLDAVALAGSLAEVVRRHETLRARFAAEGGQGVQRISAPSAPVLPCLDLLRLPAGLREAETRRVLGAEARRPFDLSRGALMRSLLVRTAEAEHVLLINFHHIVADGWSMGILIREMTFLYRALVSGTPPKLPELAIQYADFAAWQRSWLRDEVLESQLGYWKEQLDGAPLTLELPTDRPRPPVMSGRGATRFYTLREDLAEVVRALSRRSGTSAFMTFLAAFESLLFRYTGRTDFLLGTPIANRNRPEIEGLIGFFVNTLVLRARVAGGLSFERLLGRVRETAMAAYDHQDLPFEKLVEELQPVRDRSRPPIFQVMFMLLNAPAPIALPGLELSSLSLDTGTAKFDLLLILNESGEGFEGSIEYAVDLFDRTTIERLRLHFESLLEAIGKAPEAPLGQLDFLAPSERAQILVEWTSTATPFPREAAVHDLFARQAVSSPEAVALVWHDAGAVVEMTYGELDRRANQVAHTLLGRGVGHEELVGLMMERSPEMVLAVLGILKAGAAYAPFDPGYPKARLELLIEDTRVPLVLTQAHLADRLPAEMAKLCLDTEGAAIGPETAPTLRVPAEQLCYVMYTSGTTGVPKGVAVPHRGVVRLVRETGFASLGPGEVFLQLAPVSFDASTLEIWGPLLNGGRLVLHPPGPLSLDELAAAIERHGITTLWLTTGLFHQMVETHPRTLAGVPQVLTGGDVLSPRHAREMLAHAEGLFVNAYGPTENTTFTTCHPMRSGSLLEAAVPIGRPIANTTLYLLDEEMRPVPAGVAGDLFTGGDGLARGYLSRPAQTAAVFVPHPLSSAGGERLYRTGDQARYLADGRVDFLGRKDKQVKLRGFRIELGEIEARLEDLPGITQAVVVLRRDGSQGKRLVGYVVAEGEPPADLRAALEEALPPYMVPSAFVTLPEIPLDPNGKVDRKALPEPEVSEEARGLAAPATPTEEELARIYAELLGLERVGAEADFFELGGHSLLATRLVSRLRETFAIEIALGELFRQPRIRDLAARVDALRGIGRRELPPIVRASRDVPPPLSFAQQRLWFLFQLEPWNPEYHMPAAFEAHGRLDVGVLRRTLDEVVRRHEVLRTYFAEAGEEPVQVVEPPRRQELPVVDLAALPPSRRAREERRLVVEDAVRLFDLTRGPLLRTTVLRRGEKEHVLLVNQHHVVSDGWSIGVLVREVAALYRSFVAGEPSSLPELPVQYADFAVWQRGWLHGEALERQLDAWRKRLSGVVPLDLPTDRPRPAVRSGRGRAVPVTMAASLRRGLEELGRRSDATLFMTLLAAFQALLARYAGQQDVAVGTPIAGRRLPEVEGLIGFFVNTLVLRSRLRRDDSFSRLLARVRQVALEAYEHQDVPFEQLVEEVQPQRDRSRTPLFQVMLALQTAEVEPLELLDLTLVPLQTGSSSSKFDLTLSLDAELRGSIEYATELFDRASVLRLARSFEALLESVLERPSAPLSTLATVPKTERQQLLLEWNGAPLPAPLDPAAHRLVRLFEAQAGRTPEAVALVFDHGGEVERWSYAELDGRSNAVARRLRRLGVGPEALVGVAVERSPEMLAALLGVWKAGGAYVPLDPAYPPERLAFMLEDSAAAVLMTQEALKERFSGVGCPVLCLDDLGSAAEAPSPAPGFPENLAYIIYTSGSTGRAKGVAITHASALALVDWAREAFSRPSLEAVLASTSISFDISIFELFVPLAVGGRVVLVKNALALRELGVRSEVTLLNTVPSAMAELVHLEALPESVEVVNLAGEPLPGRLARQIYRQLPAAEVRNLYGPSEDTTYSTWCAVAPGQSGKPSIGRPLPGTAAYVVDPALRPVPLGAAGELYLGGAGLARGYLGRPSLTAERFLPDPWSAAAGARLYRTGDLVRYLVDGRLDFLGRLDHQVKIRGFRIELGEVEVTLEAHSAIAEAVVVAREDEPGDPRLVAYLVTSEAGGDWRAYLAERLPGYMVPSYFVVLEEMPRLPNGKVNRRALPAPETRFEDDAGYAAPRNATEEAIAEVFAELLRRQSVGIDDDFFGLGGHSLLASRAVSRLSRKLGIDLRLAEFFDAPSVAGLAERIVGVARREAPTLVAASGGGARPLSFAQRRLWFLHQLEPRNPEYHMPAAFVAHGRLELAVLQRTLDEVVRRHQVLRTRFAEVGDEPVQAVDPPRRQELPVVDLAGLPPGRREREERRLVAEDAVRLFDLPRGPLLRTTVLHRAEKEHVLLTNQHHIVSDGWSIGVLVREVGALYRAFAAGETSPLVELPIQYADFAVWQRDYLRGETLERQLAAWRARLDGVVPLELPTDRPRPAVRSSRGRTVLLTLPSSLGKEAEGLGRRNDATLFMTLLAAFQALLARYTSRHDVAVGTPVAGRRLPEVEGLIGFFVNTLVLRSQVAEDGSFSRLLAQVRETALEAYENQDVPFEHLVEELQPERDRSRTPLFQVMLALQTAEVGALDLADLRLEPLRSESGTSKFDLTLSLVPAPEGSLVGTIEYSVDLFDETSVLRFGRSFVTLLESSTREPEEPLSSLDVLAPSERAQMLAEWSATGRFEDTVTVPFKGTKGGVTVLHHLFEAQVARSPGGVALLSDEGPLTYAELDELASRLAAELRSLGVGPEVVVGVVAERVPEVVTALLAVWKAGGVYLPLDPSHPEDRRAFQLRDAGARLLLSPRDGTLVALPVTGSGAVCGQPEPDHLAYVIYTSGTTGTPKGVGVTHRQAFGVLTWFVRYFGLGEETRVLQSLSPCFDFGLFELVTTLFAGGTLYFLPEEEQGDLARYAEAVARHRLNTVHTTPSLMRELIAQEPAPAGLELVHLGGEALSRELVREIRAVAGGCRIYNGYGPTEASINSTVHLVEGEPGPAIPIGRPSAWNEAYVLDRRGRAQLCGVPGELGVGGAGLARGYLGRPALAAERFVPHPFTDHPGERLYRTGDLVRWLPGGELEFLGRIDHQVKLRGFRIELGEIEAAASGHESVSECVATVHGQRLVAWIVPSGSFAAGEVAAYLRGRLPEYMVPSSFVTLPEMPRTLNGKADRAALERRAPEPLATDRRISPRTPTEERLAEIWAEVLESGDPLGVEESFFELGGHSLLATRVVSRIRRSFGVELRLSDFFDAPRIADLARRLDAGVSERVLSLRAAARPERPPLSFAQRRLWFLHQLEPRNPEYHMPVALEAHGRLDVAVLQRTLDEVVRRHEVLRTRLAVVGEEPVQIIEPARRQQLPVVDLAALTPASRSREEHRLVAEDAVRLFDLSRGPLFRTTVLRRGEGEHVLLLNQHHVISDGWSIGVLVREVGMLYRAFRAGEESPLPPLPLQYAAFAVWQRDWLRGERLERQLDAWRARLLGVTPLELPTDRPRPAVRSGRGRVVPVALPASLGRALERLGRRGHATLFMTFLAVFQVLLARYTGSRDVAVGTPIAGRRLPEVEGLIGCFVNTLVLRSRWAARDSFSRLLAQVRETVLEAFEHQDLPFEQLVEELHARRDRSRTPLFQVMLVLQTAEVGSLELRELTLEPLPTDSATSKFDLNLALAPEPDASLRGSIEYATDLFDRATVLRLARHLEGLLEAVVASPESPVAEHAFFSAAERHQVVAEWNDTGRPQRPHEGELRLHAWIAAQAARTPGAVAVRFEGSELTYRELDSRSNQLARHLRSLGVGRDAEAPEALVGAFVERSLEMIVGLLGVLKAGGAYVPLDPGYPPDRVAFMAEDAGVSVVLTQDHLVARLPETPAVGTRTVVRLDGDWPSIARHDPEPPEEVTTPDSLAYMIYTSGSTGRPKGAMNTHRAIVNRLVWMQEAYGLTTRDRVLQKTPTSFDVSVWELFWPFMYGARQVIARPEGHKDSVYLVDLIESEGITMLHFVPSMLAVFLEEDDVERCRSLRRVVCSGEALPFDLQRRFHLRLPAELHNLYGPTEAAVDVTWWPCERRPSRSMVPIGRPVSNTEIRILDRHLRAVPIGLPGELLIGGVQLMRGYHRRPALTAEKLVPDPLGTTPGGRLYRTGDLARTLADGNVEYLGRLDHQVKIRGLRIELGEIEAALASHPAIREAVVLAVTRAAGDARLVAFLVPEDHEEAARQLVSVKKAVAERLPDYMVPSTFVLRSRLPLLPNGKADRKALAGLVPEERSRRAAAERVAPRGPLEQDLAKLWSEVLGVEDVGVFDDFFELGGHSLLATRVVSRIRRSFGVELALADFFDAPRIADLAERIEGGTPSELPPLVPVPREAPLPLSFAQRRLWFLHQLEPWNPEYHIPVALGIDGRLDVAVLRRTLDEIVRRHETLRTRFAEAGEEPVQVVEPPRPQELPVIDLSVLSPSRYETESRRLAAEHAVRLFDLARGPLLRTTVLRRGEKEHVLLLNQHHVVSDGWSLGVLVREVGVLYRTFLAGTPSPLPELPIQYADFAVWQRDWLRGTVLKRQLDAWRDRLDGIAPLELPTDRPRPAVRSGRGRTVALALDASLREALERLGRQQEATLFMTLLAAFQSLLARFAGSYDVTVGTPVAGRRLPEVEGLIGFFVNTLVLRSRFSAEESFSRLLAQVRKTALDAYENQDVPFEQLVEELHPRRDRSRTPLFQAMLALQTAEIEPLDLAGLQLRPLSSESGTSKFDLTLSLDPELSGSIEYATELFDETTVLRLARSFETLLRSVLERPSAPLATLETVPEAERQQLLVDWSAASGTASPETASSLHRLFEEQAKRAPEAEAILLDGAGRWTYAELDGRAEALAAELRALGVTAEVVVGVAAERLPEVVVSLLAVWKAGGVYLPLDPAHPEERLAFVLRDAGARVVLARRTSRLGELAAAQGVRVVLVDEERETAAAADLPFDPDHLAYVIYTSGTTGTPKGVGVTHRQVLGVLSWFRSHFGLDEQTRVLQNLSPCFDFGLFELVTTLLAGGTLCFLPEEAQGELARYAEAVTRHGLNTLHTTPSLMRELIAQDPAPAGLRLVHLGGEALSMRLVRDVAAVVGDGCRIYNGYGPTEASINSTVFLARGRVSGVTVPIGRPTAGSEAYVLDRRLQVGPCGVAGELFVGGPGLARGYLGRPALTAERFVPHPFTGRPGGRLYRTGDLVRWLSGGDLEFLGRVDHQVKLRGFRIELGEVEAAVLAHEAVSECVAAVVRGRLLAWVVAEGLQAAELAPFARAHLPEYMVPSAFVTVEEMPRTPNGKVDRAALVLRALPGPEAEAEGYVAPATETERRLADTFADLLDLEKVGRDDDFFALGGHSLLAARLISRVRRNLGVTVPVAALFAAPTLAAFAESVEAARREAGLSRPLEAMTRAAGEEAVTSFAQERLWFLDQLDPGTDAYNMPANLRLRGRLDVEALRRGLQTVIDRHEVLRTRFEIVEGRPVPVIVPLGGARGEETAASLGVSLPTIDLSALPPAEREAAVRELAAEAAGQAFDLGKGPLLDARLLRLAPEEHVFLLNLHHVAADGWSFGVLVKEVGAVYRALASGEEPELPELKIQYADFAAWQRRFLEGEELERQLAFWRERLTPPPPALELPLDRPRPAVQTYRGERRLLVLPEAEASSLRALAHGEGASLFMVLAAAFQVLLHRLSGQDDVLVGFPVAGRVRPEVEDLIGVFLNTLVLRTDCSGAPSFRELLGRVREETLGAFDHQDVPFEKVLEELHPDRDLSRTPVFQVLFNLLNLPEAELRLPGLTLEMAAEVETPSKFDLTVYAVEAGDGTLAFNLVYNADLFDAVRIEEMLAQYRQVLAQVGGNADLSIERLSLVTPSAAGSLPDPREPLAFEWRGTIPERIRGRGTPADRAAVADASETWTYGELFASSSCLAAELRGAGIGPGDVVAVDARRSARLVPALVGILEAGAAFLILDPSYPAGRRCDLARRARARGWVRLVPETDPELAAGLGGLVFDLPPRSSPAVAVAAVEVGPDTPAYVAFTSGSTGEPKGIVGGHGPVVHFLDWHTSTFELHCDDRFSLLSGLAHDPLLRDVFTPLWVGSTLVVPDPAELGTPGWLADWVRREEVRVAHLTPAMGRLLTEGVREPMPTLRALFFSGDRLPARDLARMRELVPRAFCVNFYGATETPQAMSFHVVRGEEPQAVLPLGRGIDGVQLLVRNASGEPAGVGELGEISVRTPYLAHGYLDAPFAGDEYRTGDRGRYLLDGEVEFVGRADDQVQIRGFRVEPGEVEAALRAHPQVHSAAVLPSEGVLLAFVIGTAPTDALRTHLRQRLPGYMVPRSIVVLESLPLLPTGKLDRRALLALAPASAAGGEVATPRTPAEEIVAGIFGELLGLDAVPADGDFFALGGHSLLATRALARLRDALGVELSVRRIFAAPTVAGLAAEAEEALRREQGLVALPIERRPREAEIPLSFSQERLWFLALLEPESPAYNVFTALGLRGRLDEEAFRAALAEIVRRHESLRTTFAAVGGRPVQRIASPEEAVAGLPFKLREVDEDKAQTLLEECVREPFDLTAGPLFRVCLLRLAEDKRVGVLVMHHIISDAWSLGVLVRELVTLYGAFREGAEARLEELPVQYADYALWQRRWLSVEALESQLAWWKEALAGAPPALDLPTDRPRPTVPSGRGALLHFELPPGDQLRTLGRAQGTTLFMTLLTGFMTLLGRYSGQRDLVVGTPVANRSRVELEGLIGFFVNTLVLRTDLSGGPSFLEALGRVREGALGAYAHRDLPFERLVEELQPRRDLSRTPLFQVMFVLQNAPAAAVELPGLVLEPLMAERGTARFDLLLTLTESSDGLAGSLEYSSDLYDRATVERLVIHLRTLLDAAARVPGTRLGELPLLGAAEERQLAEWNATSVAYEPWPSLHAVIEAQAERTPGAVALRFEGESLTYRELNERANRLARHLQRLGVGPDTLVGVAAERSFELVVALLGILKAGGAYVPMDPGYPRDRLAFMLEDASVPVLLTQERLVAELPEPPAGTRIVCLDAEATAAENAADLPWHGTASSLAYMIFTSGSTGRPKGAMVSHGAIVNRLQWMQEAYGLIAEDRVMQKTPFSFDVSVWEFFWPLMFGARLVVARPGGHQDPAYLARLIVEEGVTTMHFVPSMLQIFVEHSGVEACTSLQRVIASGEALPYDLEQRFFSRLAGSELHNLYGPTEAAVDVTYQPCSVSEERQAVAIGRPIANLRIHVLDRRLRPVPIGVAGELLIAGVGLGRGYLKRPGLTAEKFVPDPLAAEPGARAYKTGDLTRFLADGAIDYLGRLDHQVKVRGFRIELGEIEACLLDQPEIREAVVMAREDIPGDARLVAYVVPHAATEDVSPERLRAALGATLPEYMVPSLFAVLEALPLNPSGKADRGALARQALPAPGGERRQSHPPRDAVELELVRIWEEVLGTSPVGVRDDFFELGGHSLSAVRVVARIEEKMGRTLPLQTFFRGATLESLARQLRGETVGPVSCLLELQRGAAAERPPLVCVHPAGGNVLAYLPLARALGPGQTVYAFQSVGLDDDAAPLETVEEMAARYVSEWVAASPRGPYALLGWSFGGLVAYEMARELRRGGHEVAWVVLLDTAVPRRDVHEDLPQDDDAYWLADVALFLSAMEGREPPVSQEELADLPPAEQMRRFLGALQDLGYLPPGIGEIQVRRLLRVYKANVRAQRSYEPPASKERVVLLRAAEGDVHAARHADDPTLGWGEVIGDTLEITKTPGEHLTLLARDHVGALAEILHALLEGKP